MGGDTVLTISPHDARSVVPVRLQHHSTTLRELLTHDLDIRGQPKRYFFELLGHFAASEHEVRGM
jgi:sulfite reductase alpha subunit-like flavoprotein